jgi:hypothetical protein
LKIAIMQPYFFPYIGYISLIKHTDRFILLDVVQFIRHGWIERNRILKQPDGWMYIKVPLIKDHRETLIKDKKIDNNQNWKNNLVSQLLPYQKIAPYFKDVMELINALFVEDFNDIVRLDKVILQSVCSYLGIHRQIEIFSEMQLRIDPVSAPDEWALNICKALGQVDEYWNPPGGQGFFDKSKYENARINLRFHKINLEDYDQKRLPFESGLSIIDVLMFNSKEEINRMLDNYELH